LQPNSWDRILPWYNLCTVACKSIHSLEPFMPLPFIACMLSIWCCGIVLSVKLFCACRVCQTGFLPAFEKIGKICHLFLTPDHVILLHNVLNSNGVQAVAQFKKVSGKNEWINSCIIFRI
jgi:hypothetical protein